MENILKIVNKLQKARLIKNYAIGYEIAAIYYTEPFHIKGLEVKVFFIPPEGVNPQKVSSEIRAWLSSKGYKRTKDMPLHLICATDELTREAIKKGVRIKYKHTVTRIFRPEYIIAMMMRTYSTIDQITIDKLLRQTKVNKQRLNVVLNKFELLDKFRQYQELRKISRPNPKPTPPSFVRHIHRSIGQSPPTTRQISNFQSSIKHIFRNKERQRLRWAKEPFPSKIDDLKIMLHRAEFFPHLRQGETIAVINVH